jgi:hypothetical protein
MRYFLALYMILFQLSDSSALIIKDREIILKLSQNVPFDTNFPNLVDLSDYILNDNGTSLDSNLWEYTNHGFFDEFDFILGTPYTHIIGQNEKDIAILFSRNDSQQLYFCLTQHKLNEFDLLAFGQVIKEMKEELAATLLTDEDDSSSTLRSLEEQIQSMEQTPWLYNAAYNEEPNSVELQFNEEEMQEGLLEEYAPEVDVQEENMEEFSEHHDIFGEDQDPVEVDEEEIEEQSDESDEENQEDDDIEEQDDPNEENIYLDIEMPALNHMNVEFSEKLAELKAMRDSFNEQIMKFLDLDQILARLKLDKKTQHYDEISRYLVLQELGFI